MWRMSVLVADEEILSVGGTAHGLLIWNHLVSFECLAFEHF